MISALRSRGAPSARWLRACLAHEPSATEVSPAFAVPVSATPWGATDAIRYALKVVTVDGDIIHLRSHGVPFNVHPRPWLGQGIRSSFSIGPGLAGEREQIVVLVQSFHPDAASRLDVLAGDDRWADRPLRHDGRCYGRPCSLLSGILDS